MKGFRKDLGLLMLIIFVVVVVMVSVVLDFIESKYYDFNVLYVCSFGFLLI